MSAFDLHLEIEEQQLSACDYSKGQARWCPGCGDHAVLTAVQKLCAEEQLPREKTVFVSGIGCSSRFPHYMNTYGFHGLHGRAFPVASGVKFRRPDLHVFVVTGDGDCCSIGAGAWVHAIRYNIDLTVLLFDNQIYGMTKKQTSPTSRMGTISNTHPHGSVLPPINPIQTTLGISNASFVAQTVDWIPGHLYATIKAAHAHKGLSFVRISMRCPKFLPDLSDEKVSSKDSYCLLEDARGIQLDDATRKQFKHSKLHDPSDIHAARSLAQDEDAIYLGLFYQDPNALRYDLYGAHNLGFSNDRKLAAINAELDRFAV